MSSSELSDDEYDCSRYLHNQLESRPPLVSKKRRLIAAAAQNDVDTLKELLDSPKWYKVRDGSGNNLLHIIVILSPRIDNYEVFNYLLSLGDFPLDEVDESGCTALEKALSYLRRPGLRWVPPPPNRIYEHHAIELIKKGANIDIECHSGYLYQNTFLHFAVANLLPRVVQSLIERGADINKLDRYGYTPLHRCVELEFNNPQNHCRQIEIIMMLLCYGADPSIHYTDDDDDLTALNIFLCFLIDYTRNDSVYVALENLFYFTVDEWSLNEIAAEGLIYLAHIKSPLFDQVVMKYSSEIIIGPCLYSFSLCLFTIDVEYLRILLEKYPYIVKLCLQTYDSLSLGYISCATFDKFKLENFEMLRQSLLEADTLELISKLNCRDKYCSFISSILLKSGKNLDEFFEFIYYLLSYGMILTDIDLQDIYKVTGFSKDFKNLLFMDIQKYSDEQIRDMMLLLIYDVTLDIHKIVEEPSLCKFINWDQIFHYFIHPKIQKAYHQLKPNETIGRQLPRIPLLQELARDALRKYFIKELKITTAKEFYTLLGSIQCSTVHKKIITYETKLY